LSELLYDAVNENGHSIVSIERTHLTFHRHNLNRKSIG